MVTWVEVTWMEALLNQLPVLFQCASSGAGAEGLPEQGSYCSGFPVTRGELPSCSCLSWASAGLWGPTLISLGYCWPPYFGVYPKGLILTGRTPTSVRIRKAGLKILHKDHPLWGGQTGTGFQRSAG